MTPLIDQAAEFGASLLRKLALFLVAAACLLITVVSATIAFGLWIASLAGPVIGALAVAGLYLLIGGVCILLAIRPARSTRASRDADADQNEAAADTKTRPRSEQIDRFTGPLLGILSALGLRREQIAVLAGASIAKQLGPIPLVGAAILAGFLIGRMYKGWRAFLSFDALAAILSTGLFRGGDEPTQQSADQKS